MLGGSNEVIAHFPRAKTLQLQLIHKCTSRGGKTQNRFGREARKRAIIEFLNVSYQVP